MANLNESDRVISRTDTQTIRIKPLYNTHIILKSEKAPPVVISHLHSFASSAIMHT